VLITVALALAEFDALNVLAAAIPRAACNLALASN